MAEIRIDGKTLSHIRTNVLDGNMYWQHPLKSGGNTFYGRTADGYLYRGNDLATWNWVTRSDLGAGILKRTIQQIADKSQSSGWQLVATSQALGRGRALPSGLTVLTDIIGNVRPPIAADVSAHQRGGTVSSPGFLFEAGTRKVSQSGPDEWHAVSLSNAYTAPVVLVSPLSYYGNQPATVRVRKVTSSGFEFQIDEWDYLEGAHKTETIHFAVFEAGRYPLTNGGELEAGIVNASSSFSGIPFTADFADIPVVLGQIVTANDVRAAAPRQRNVTSTRFELLIQGEETDRTHGDEKVAYVALTKGTGTLGSRAFVANTTAEGVNHTFLTVPFEKTFSASPIFLASMQTANGMDSATLRFRSLSDSSVDVMVEEEQSKDLEMTHGREVVGYLAFESESVLASAAAEEAGIDAKDLSGAEVANADTLGTTVDHFELLGNFPNPFNPETTIRYALPEETHVTLEVYDLLGRRVAVLVDSVQPAGTHGASFNAENLASGIYMYHLRAGSHARTAQMILMK